jgi:hypothetical protein
VASERISILMKSTADVSLGLIPIHEAGLAGSEPLLSLAQNVFVPGRGLEAIRVEAQVLPEGLHSLELFLDRHLAEWKNQGQEEIIAERTLRVPARGPAGAVS